MKPCAQPWRVGRYAAAVEKRPVQNKGGTIIKDFLGKC
jgi:hypothetical protein